MVGVNHLMQSIGGERTRKESGLCVRLLFFLPPFGCWCRAVKAQPKRETAATQRVSNCSARTIQNRPHSCSTAQRCILRMDTTGVPARCRPTASSIRHSSPRETADRMRRLTACIHGKAVHLQWFSFMTDREQGSCNAVLAS